MPFCECVRCTVWKREGLYDEHGWVIDVCLPTAVFAHDAYFYVYLLSVNETSFLIQIPFLCTYACVTVHTSVFDLVIIIMMGMAAKDVM